MATDAVSSQWRAQLPALVDAVAEELQIQFPDGIHAGRMDSEYVRRQKADAARLAEEEWKRSTGYLKEMEALDEERRQAAREERKGEVKSEERADRPGRTAGPRRTDRA